MDAVVETNARIATRQRVLKSGKIVLNDWTAIDCQVRDLSATGAKLVCDNALTLPEVFRLILSTDNTIRPVKIMWRKQFTIGVHFTAEAKRAPIRKL